MPTQPGVALHSGLRMSFAGLTHLQVQQVLMALLCCCWGAVCCTVSSFRVLLPRCGASVCCAILQERHRGARQQYQSDKQIQLQCVCMLCNKSAERQQPASRRCAGPKVLQQHSPAAQAGTNQRNH